MVENFQAIIGAKINDFNRKMKQVDKKVRETAFEATKPIGANVKEFMAKMKAVQATAKRVLKRDDKTISADISRFLRKAAEVAVVARALTREKVIVPIQASWRNYQNVMGRIASFNRAMGEIMQMSAQGIMISLSPAIVPIIASLVGLLGQLGPMLGTIGGSAFALGTAFATAGIGAAGFGAIAVTNLKDVFSASSDLKKLQEKLDDATDLKERNKILKEMQAIQGSLNADQTKALNSMNKLKDTWTGIAKGLETKTIQIFTQSLDIFGSVLTSLKPMFTSVTDAVSRLTASLGQTIKSDSMKAFFDYLNTSAGPMLETITKAVGNFFLGFFNMMVAFGPLAENTANGFLRMSEGFAEWSSKLGESAKFQAFVDYVNENMPKIRSIFSDAIQGMINMFAAFAPSSADMMTSLQDMMERFKEWSSTLSQNQGFQNFINYIKENGPKVVSLIGNITTFLVNLGIALAPMGSFMLDLINKFLSWSSAMLENHPLIGKIAAVVVVLGGAFFALLPHVVGLIALFGSLPAPMFVAAAGMVSTAATFISKWAMIAASSTANAIKTGAAWALATGAKMVSAVAKMVASAAIFVAKWVWMGVQALAQAARMAAAWFIALGPIGWVTAAIIGIVALVIANWDKVSDWTKKAWTAVSAAVTTAVDKVASWVQEKFPKVYEVIKSAMENTKEIVSAVWDLIKTTFSNVLSILKSLVKGDFEGIKQTISSQMDSVKATITRIWDAIKAHFSNVLSFLVSTVVAKFVAIVSNVKGKMESVKSAISSKWEEAKSATISKIASIVSSVSSKFAQIVSVIKAKMNDVKNGIQNAWEKTKAVTSQLLGQVYSVVQNKFNAVVSFITNLGTTFYNAGKGLIQQLLNGITSMIDKVKSTISNVAGRIRDFLPFSPAKVGPLSDLDHLDFAGPIQDSLKRGRPAVQKAMTDLLSMKGVTTAVTAVAKKHASEMTKIDAAARKDRAAVQKDSMKKEHELERKAAQTIQTIQATAASRKRKLTAAESLRIRNIKKDLAVNVQKIEEDSNKKLASIDAKAKASKVKAESNLAKARLDVIKQFVDDKKSTEELTLVAEANVWRRSITLFKSGSKERVEAQKKYRDTLNTIDSEMIKASENFATKQSEINNKLISDEENLTKAYVDAVSSRADAIKSFAGLFDEIKQPEEAVSGEQLLGNLEDQVKSMQKWQMQVRELAAKGIDEGLLEELRQMGPKAVNELAALNSMTGSQLTTYSNLFKQKSAIARKEAEYELSGMKTDTARQIEALRKAANAELAKLKTDFIGTIKSLTEGTDTKLKTLSQIGKDAIKGLQKGMIDMSPALLATARGLANSISTEIAKALKVKSPSRVMMELGGYVVKGIAVGIGNNEKRAFAAISSVAAGMTRAFNPQIAMPLMDVSIAPLDTTSQMDAMKRQIKQELSVDMTVNHSGNVSNSANASSESKGDIVINVDGYEFMRVMYPHIDNIAGAKMNTKYLMKGV